MAFIRTAEGRVLAGSVGDGLYQSDDEGGLWTPVDAPLRSNTVFALAEKPGGGLLAATSTGIFRSATGETWERMGADIGRASAITATEDAIFAASGGFPGVVYRSEDSGTIWEEVYSVDLLGDINMSFGPDRAVYLTSRTGIFRTLDGGDIWNQVSNAPIVSRVFFIGGAAYAAGNQSVYRSTDGGATWAVVGLEGELMGDMAVTSDGYLLASVVFGYDVEAGVYRSEDGVTWTRLAEPGEGIFGAYALLAEAGAGTHAFAGTLSHIYRLSEGTDEWVEMEEGFERAPSPSAFAQTDAGIFAAGSYQEYGTRGIYLLGENPELWAETGGEGLPIGDNNRLRVLTAMSNGTLLGVANGGTYQSEDGGATWELSGLGTVRAIAFAVTSTGTVVAGASGGRVYRSEDEETWMLTATLAGYITDVAAGPDETLYAGMVGTFEGGVGGVSRSFDDGRTWTSTSLNGTNVNAIIVDTDGAVYASVDGYEGDLSEGVYRSDDAGQTWTLTGLEERVSDLIVDASDAVFAASGSVYRSSDGGQTWTLANDGLEERSVSVLFIDRAGYLWAGTNQGAYRSAAPLPVSGEIEPEGALAFALAPAYPNPAASSMRIPFALSEAGPVTLTVHDVLGRRVATLVDAVLPAGEQEVMWDAAGAASGVYIVTLRAGGRTAARRIAVAR
ncbi:MAG: T9SS type A sorting domain-containing protein [Rhodothermales bacterium]